MPNTDDLIADLVGDLRPVRHLRQSQGLWFIAAAIGVCLAAVLLSVGMRPDLAVGRLDPMFLMGSGSFLILGLAAAVTVVIMGRPQVGTDHRGWLWAGAMAAVLPLAALITGIANGPATALARSAPDHGIICLLAGSALGLIPAILLVSWLRRGAPTSPERAGLVTGVAAGSLGIFAVSMNCPHSDIMHIGLWHSLAVVVCAAAGRAIIPRLIRW
ncbi:MAG: NrsF family protein [Sandarakinorhabdus sp.]